MRIASVVAVDDQELGDADGNGVHRHRDDGAHEVPGGRGVLGGGLEILPERLPLARPPAVRALKEGDHVLLGPVEVLRESDGSGFHYSPAIPPGQTLSRWRGYRW